MENQGLFGDKLEPILSWMPSGLRFGEFDPIFVAR